MELVTSAFTPARGASACLPPSVVHRAALCWEETGLLNLHSPSAKAKDGCLADSGASRVCCGRRTPGISEMLKEVVSRLLVCAAPDGYLPPPSTHCHQELLSSVWRRGPGGAQSSARDRGSLYPGCGGAGGPAGCLACSSSEVPVAVVSSSARPARDVKNKQMPNSSCYGLMWNHSCSDLYFLSALGWF